MNTIGTRYRTAIFGTSHGPFVGCSIEGLKAGTKVDEALVQAQLDRRRPGQSLVTSQRMEEDTVEFSHGLRDGEATGEAGDLVVPLGELEGHHGPVAARVAVGIGPAERYGRLVQFQQF
ncbi:MAG: chorismate synthase, partial [Candidatus Thermoplasmatota archaeon]